MLGVLIKKKLLNYGNELKKTIEKYFNPSRSGLKILTNKQMLNRLPMLLAQIQAGNNSKKNKKCNETNIILVIKVKSINKNSL